MPSSTTLTETERSILGLADENQLLYGIKRNFKAFRRPTSRLDPIARKLGQRVTRLGACSVWLPAPLGPTIPSCLRLRVNENIELDRASCGEIRSEKGKKGVFFGNVTPVLYLSGLVGGDAGAFGVQGAIS